MRGAPELLLGCLGEDGHEEGLMLALTLLWEGSWKYFFGQEGQAELCQPPSPCSSPAFSAFAVLPNSQKSPEVSFVTSQTDTSPTPSL